MNSTGNQHTLLSLEVGFKYLAGDLGPVDQALRFSSWLKIMCIPVMELLLNYEQG